MTRQLIHPFEVVLSTLTEEIEFELRGQAAVPWNDFILNPRKVRGSDFLMRWSQGQWSEERIKEAVDKTDRFFALPYGPSGTAPDDDIRKFEIYFERLEAAGLGNMKRPDLLIFKVENQERINQIVGELQGIEELPFTSENDARMQELLSMTIIAVECENSLWRATKMPAYGSELRPMKRLGGRLGLPKGAKLPSVIIKDEDRVPLKRWQDSTGISIHVWQVFYDKAYGLSLNDAEQLFDSGIVEPKEQSYSLPGGNSKKKWTYFTPYQYAYELGESREDPELVPDYIEDKNGHILPYVKFRGGSLELSETALRILHLLAQDKPPK
jgi:hypothetical protein